MSDNPNLSPSPSGDANSVVWTFEMEKGLTGGVFGELVTVGHTRDLFTVDFAAVGDTHVDADGKLHRHAVATARVRIPASSMEDMVNCLSSNLEAWKKNFPAGEPEPTL